MDDETMKNYIEQEKIYRDEALKNAKGYLKARKPDVDLKTLQDIIIPLLHSYEYRLRQAKIKASQGLKNTRFELAKKTNLIDQTEVYNKRLTDLERVLKIDFVNNGYVNGRVTYGLCEEFTLEDHESYSLFHEVLNYFEKHTKDDDKDRLEILSRIYKLKSLVTSAKNEAISKEQEFIQWAVEVIKREMNSFSDLINKDIFAAFNDFIHSVRKHKYNSDYMAELYLGHYPVYDDKVKNSFDGFGEDAKNKTSKYIKYQLLLIGYEKERSLVHPSNYDMDRIYDLIERKQEVEELLSLVSRIEIALEQRNHTPISGDANAILDYDQAVISASDLRKYCEVLIDRYEKELESLRYDELVDNIESAIEVRDMVSSIEQREEKTEEDKEPSILSTEDINNKMIKDLSISNELLELACEDLFIFGYLSTNKLSELEPHQVTSVITRALKLREIAYLSDDDKTVIRATWPRMVNGVEVRTETPTQQDVESQKSIDNMNNIISRINSCALDLGMNL